jgi:hypothetical protein
VILKVILVMDGWIYSSKPNTERDALTNTTDPKLIDEIALADPDTGQQIKGVLFIDESELCDIRNLAKQGIRPMFYLVEDKR